jgi:hypothetical protein
MDLPCDYFRTRSTPSSGGEDVEEPASSQTSRPLLPGSVLPTFPAKLPLLGPNSSRELQLPHSVGTTHLTSFDMELLSHYIQHTGNAMATCPEDIIALTVGVPNVAFQSVPIMYGVLATGAVCLAVDIIEQIDETPHDSRRGRIQELLDIGSRHLSASLDQVQHLMVKRDPQDHDIILISSYLCALYGMASQRTRVWLTMTTEETEVVEAQFSAYNSHWITLIHSIHTTSSGLVTQEAAGSSQHMSALWGVDDLTTTLYSKWAYDEAVANTIRPPPPVNTHSLYPIIAATRQVALDKLYQKIDALHSLPEYDGTQGTWICQCFSALTVLQNISCLIFPSPDQKPDSEFDQLGFDFLPVGKLNLTDWWRQFLVRLTGVASSKPPRRVILGFINRVLDTYLTLVQTSLDALRDGAPTLGREGAAALEVFAHWLVHVILIDAIWWVGDIGYFDLGRVVRAFRGTRLVDWTVEGEGEWWPETMYRAATELGRQKRS